MPLRELEGIALPDELRDAVAEGRVGALVADTRHVLAANDHYLELIGFTREEVTEQGLSWLRLTPPEWLATDARAIGELNATGRARPYEKEYVRRDGSRVRIRMALLPAATDDEPDRMLAICVRADDDDATGVLDVLV